MVHDDHIEIKRSIKPQEKKERYIVKHKISFIAEFIVFIYLANNKSKNILFLSVQLKKYNQNFILWNETFVSFIPISF